MGRELFVTGINVELDLVRIFLFIIINGFLVPTYLSHSALHSYPHNH